MFTPLFHFTSFMALSDILESNRLGKTKCSPVSLTRDMNHGFSKRGAQIALVLNREKLATRYKLDLTKGDGSKMFSRVLSNERETRTTVSILPLHTFVEEIAVTSGIETNMRDKSLYSELEVSLERYVRDNDLLLSIANFKSLIWYKNKKEIL